MDYEDTKVIHEDPDQGHIKKPKQDELVDGNTTTAPDWQQEAQKKDNSLEVEGEIKNPEQDALDQAILDMKEKELLVKEFIKAGMSEKKAMAFLEAYGYEAIGNGDVLRSQEPDRDNGVLQKYIKYTIYALSVIALLAVLVWGVIVLTTPTKSTIDKWVASKNHNKLGNFISSNYGWLDKSYAKYKLYLYAVSEAVHADNTKYKSTLIDVLTKADYSTRTELIQMVCTNKLEPGLISGMLTVVLDKHHGTPPQPKETQQQLTLIDSALLKLPSATADSLLIVALAGQLDLSYGIGELVSRAEKFSVFSREAYPVFGPLYDDILLYDKQTQNIRNLEETTSAAETSLVELESELAEVMDRLNRSFLLDFWVAAQTSYKQYEIVLDNWGYGRAQHAILRTIDTEYTTTGYARLYVLKGFDEEVQIKEDYGGFTQSWPVFIEYTTSPEDASKSLQLKGKIREFREVITKSHEQLKLAPKIMDEFREQILKVINKYNE